MSVKQHGGARRNAGRPKGQGPHGESTQPLRVPLSKVDAVKQLIAQGSCVIPLFSHKVAAGFPSPADDHIEAQLDLNHYLVAHPAATFMVRAVGDSMRDAGIFSGDLLIVDRSVEAVHGKIVIAAVAGDLTVKRLCLEKERVFLMPENSDFTPIEITGEMDAMIWGVVIHVVRHV